MFYGIDFKMVQTAFQSLPRTILAVPRYAPLTGALRAGVDLAHENSGVIEDIHHGASCVGAKLETDFCRSRAREHSRHWFRR